MKYLALLSVFLSIPFADCKHRGLTAPIVYATQIDSTVELVDNQIFYPKIVFEKKMQMVVCLDSAIQAHKDSLEKKAKK